jgi:hypothetical protein
LSHGGGPCDEDEVEEVTADDISEGECVVFTDECDDGGDEFWQGGSEGDGGKSDDGFAYVEFLGDVACTVDEELAAPWEEEESDDEEEGSGDDGEGLCIVVIVEVVRCFEVEEDDCERRCEEECGFKSGEEEVEEEEEEDSGGGKGREGVDACGALERVER